MVRNPFEGAKKEPGFNGAKTRGGSRRELHRRLDDLVKRGITLKEGAQLAREQMRKGEMTERPWTQGG